MSEYDLPTTMNGGALLLALLGILAVVMLAILRQRADADTAAPQSPAPARPCLWGSSSCPHPTEDCEDCGGTGGSIVPRPARRLSDSNVSRVLELERQIKRLAADIGRAEALEES